MYLRLAFHHKVAAGSVFSLHTDDRICYDGSIIDIKGIYTLSTEANVTPREDQPSGCILLQNQKTKKNHVVAWIHPSHRSVQTCVRVCVPVGECSGENTFSIQNDSPMDVIIHGVQTVFVRREVVKRLRSVI